MTRPLPPYPLVCARVTGPPDTPLVTLRVIHAHSYRPFLPRLLPQVSLFHAADTEHLRHHPDILRHQSPDFPGLPPDFAPLPER